MEQEEKQIFYPLLLDISKFKCLVVGGGRVALRKVKDLLEFEADVTIISPEICFELANLVQVRDLPLQKRNYCGGDSEGYQLVFVATDDPQVLGLVKSDCDKCGTLLNIAEKPELSNIIIPATIKESSFTISVATSGDALFFNKKIRDILRKNLPENIGDIAYLAGEFRQKVLNDNRFDTQEKKDDLFDRFLFVDWSSIIEDSGFEGAFLRMAEILK